MDPRTQQRVEEWDSRPFGGGFDGLSDLAATDFSGAVSAAGTWLFMLNGRIIGIVDGDIEEFETASGTKYEAPDPSLPLLCTMEERGGETRAQYYTNETPLREVDETLQSGSFTGYIELSENVLSGDYYVVYYGGRRMAAAYIGNAERLLTGEEAFDRAADEVGIYEVTDVEIEVTDVPGADPASPSGDDSGDEPDASSISESAGTGTVGSATDDSVSDRDDSSGDSTGSGIEPIDVSSTDPVGTDDVTDDDSPQGITADDSSPLMGDLDLTDDPTGITTTDETKSTESGLTEPSVDPTPDSSPDSAEAEAEAEDGGQTGAQDVAGRSGRDGRTTPRAVEEPTSEPLTDEPADADRTTDESADSTGSADESIGTAQPTDEPAVTEPSSVTDDGGRQTPSSAEGETLEAEADVATPAETGGDDTATDAATSPDLAEVEAAAEELDRNDISWVDDGTAGKPGGDESATETQSGESTPAEEEDGYLEEQLEREEAWRETRRIPSIDPDNEAPTADASGGSNRSRRASRSSAASGAGTGSRPTSSTGTRTDTTSSERGAEPSSSTAASSETRGTRSQEQSAREESGQSRSTESADERAEKRDRKRVAALTEKVETLQEQRDALVTKAEELETERDRLRSENDELSATVERLRSRIEDLETELERERARTADADGSGADATAGPQLSPQQALSGTNLFVRYSSKSQPTLETAHDGDADRSEVASNLRLEHHTQFESADATVDGEPYDEFLASSMEHRFVDWLTEMLLYEIRDTGNANGLVDLYDAIPRIDRAELDATISLADDDTDDVPDEVTFDIVVYDKMGNPLVLVTLNDSREPAAKGMLEGLEEAASAVKANYPDLAAAIAVTSSYFEPGALEVAEQATSGGFLSRGSKLSYVNLSRKDGYHLCLVESRSEGFHMNVPEL
ncbi:DUF7527 domain-containing protein [Natrinema ejinorense]|uniref:Transcriptional regulator n=1 Tax=Natrinema ejinorense TaxID=373386 RepID=A0A2A5QX16_9EURY|nr:transcriptional regulator [Natrinema ejinorense]PCR91355.1 transcriptional regulator [Natrinema ejinorense]